MFWRRPPETFLKDILIGLGYSSATVSIEFYSGASLPMLDVRPSPIAVRAGLRRSLSGSQRLEVFAAAFCLLNRIEGKEL